MLMNRKNWVHITDLAVNDDGLAKNPSGVLVHD